MMIPNAYKPDGTPIFDGDNWESPAHLMSDLAREEMPLPCWIKFAASAYRIPPENRAGVLQGLMIASEMGSADV